MATIGKFNKEGNDYTGTIETLTWSTPATLKAISKTSDKGPDFRVIARRGEIGAGWKKTSEAGVSYLSIAIDDPSFEAPLNCRLHEAQAGDPFPNSFDLVWTR